MVSRVVGGAGVFGVAVYQPMVVEGVGALALLLVVGVVFPAVWSRHATRRRAAATVLRLLLTALVGRRIATAVTDATAAALGRPDPRPESAQTKTK
jgi:hypothetical protein